MTDHEHFEELISEKLDGVITAEGERELAAHLASCPECRELYDILSGVREALEGEAEAPEELLPRVMTGVRAVKRRRAARTRALTTGVLAAAAVLAVAVLPAAWRSRPAGQKADLMEASAAPEDITGSGAAETPQPQSRDGADPAMLFNPALPGASIPVPYSDEPPESPEISESPGSPEEDPLSDCHTAARFDSLPASFTQSAPSYPLPDGSTAYVMTPEQFEEFKDSAVEITHPDPSGNRILAILPE